MRTLFTIPPIAEDEPELGLELRLAYKQRIDAAKGYMQHTRRVCMTGRNPRCACGLNDLLNQLRTDA